MGSKSGGYQTVSSITPAYAETSYSAVSNRLGCHPLGLPCFDSRIVSHHAAFAQIVYIYLTVICLPTIYSVTFSRSLAWVRVAHHQIIWASSILNAFLVIRHHSTKTDRPAFLHCSQQAVPRPQVLIQRPTVIHLIYKCSQRPKRFLLLQTYLIRNGLNTMRRWASDCMTNP